MAFSDIFAGGPTLDPALMQQMKDVNAPLPEQSTWGKASGWLSNPENQLRLLQIGGAIAPEGTIGKNLATNLSPSLKGQVMKNQTDAEKRKASKIFDQYHADLLAAPHVGGITLKDDGKGGTTSTITATSQKDMATAQAMAAQQQAAQIPGVAPAATPAQLPGAPEMEAVIQPQAGVDQAPTKASQIFNPGGGGTAQGPFGQAGPGSNQGRIAQIAQAESGNRNYNADGSPVVSPKGARYAMQVLPSTAGKPGYGVTPAAANTPAEFNRVGQEYYNAMLQKYGGDESKALAAYHDGPGNVDAAIAQFGENYMQGLSPAGQAYVGKILGSRQVGAQVVAAPSTRMLDTGPAPIAARTPPVRLSQFMGSAPPYTVTGYGLDPQEMLAAQKAGQSNALFPVAAAKAQADLEHTQAVTEGTQVATQGKRLGLPGKKTTRIDGALVGMPGTQLDLDSKEMASVGTKLKELQIRSEEYGKRAEIAQSLGDLRTAQKEKALEEATQKKARRELLASGKPNAIFPGTDITYEEARVLDAAGTLDDYTRAAATARAQEKTARAIQDRSLAKDVRSAMRKMETDLDNDFTLGGEAKKAGLTREQYKSQVIAQRLRRDYGPNWRQIAELEQGGVGTKVPKYNAATGAFE